MRSLHLWALEEVPSLISPCGTLCPMPWRAPDCCAIPGLPGDFLPSFWNASSQEGAATQSRNRPGAQHSPGQPRSLQGRGAGVTGTQRSARRHSVGVVRDSSALASDNPRRRAAEGRVPPDPRSRCDWVKGRFPTWLPPSSPPSPCLPSGGDEGSLRHPRAHGAYLSGEHRGRGPGGPHPAPWLCSTDPTLTVPSGGPDREPPAGPGSTIRSVPHQHRGQDGLLGSTR